MRPGHCSLRGRGLAWPGLGEATNPKAVHSEPGAGGSESKATLLPHRESGASLGYMRQNPNTSMHTAAAGMPPSSLTAETW